MKTLWSSLWFVCLGACATGSGMGLSFQRTIPRDATVIRLQSDLRAEQLFSRAHAVLAEQGFGFSRVDSSALTFETDAIPLGRSRSPLRISIRVEPSGTGAVASATGQTLLGVGIWGRAANSADTKARDAFQEMVLLLGRLPNREISYSTS